MKKLLVLTLTLVFLPSYSFAAIAFDNSASATNAGTSPLAVTLNIGAISNGILFICFGTNSSNPNSPTASWNGSSTGVSLVDSVTTAGQNTYLFMLINPTTGSHSASVSYTVDDGNKSDIYAASYSGAAQTGQPDNHGNTASGANPLTETLITVANNSWMVTCDGGARSPTASTNSTVRSALPNGHFQYFDNNAAITPAGSYTMTQTVSGTGNTAAFASFSPVASATTAKPFFWSWWW